MPGTLTPSTPEEICHLVASDTTRRVLPVGSRTKSALSNTNSDDITLVDMRGIAGIIDYQPSDFTITVQSGTRVDDVQKCLAEHGQFLPFDPPMIQSGATIGGMIASGWNGSCRMLWGGIRDFILAVDFVDGLGNLVRGGAAVVKNTAGYDLPKFFVGSYGQFGILTSICFKVFPKPIGYQTLVLDMANLESSLHAMSDLSHHPIQIVAMDLESNRLHIRIAGDETALAATEHRVSELLHDRECNRLSEKLESEYWTTRSNPKMDLDQFSLVKILCNRSNISLLDKSLHSLDLRPYYCHGGNSCLVEWPTDVDIAKLNEALVRQAHQGVVLLSKQIHGLLGLHAGRDFWNRIRAGLDPNKRFHALFLE